MSIETTEQAWVNYGDVNPSEHGGLWIKPDGPEFPGCFNIVELAPMPDRFGWWLSEGYVDVHADWIDWPKVYEHSGCTWADTLEVKAIGAFQYYGPVEFNGSCDTIYRASVLAECLKIMGIELE